LCAATSAVEKRFDILMCKGNMDVERVMVLYREEKQSQNKAVARYVYKRRTLSHATPALAAKKSGAAHESSRIWHIPGKTRDLVSAIEAPLLAA
jgi:hypothetical protein